jgi:hypothetical protein
LVEWQGVIRGGDDVDNTLEAVSTGPVRIEKQLTGFLLDSSKVRLYGESLGRPKWRINHPQRSKARNMKKRRI